MMKKTTGPVDSIGSWKRACNRIGRPFNISVALTAFFPVLYLCFRYNCWPDAKTLLTGWGMAVAAYGACYVVEPVSYFAALGVAGTYLSFSTGNISNMRLPSAALALDETKSEPGTLRAEIISTLAICGSIFLSLTGLLITAFIGTTITNILPEAVKSGANAYAATAIFGATLGNYFLKEPKLAALGLIAPVAMKLMTWFVDVPDWVTGIFMLVSVVCAVAIARVIYVRRERKNAAGGEQ